MRRQNFMLTHAITADPVYEFASEVRAGLMKPGQKELPSKYLYDDVGSALFEVISVLPEYGLTRADERLLGRYASEIVERLPLPLMVAELGSGSGKKTRWILKALCRRQHTSYFPIEISRTALAMCARELGDIESMSIVGFEREYLDGLLEVAARRRNGQHLLVLFLGSTIGNFDRSRTRRLTSLALICPWNSHRAKRSGRKAAISTLLVSPFGSPGMLDSVASLSGWTTNGPSRKTCSLPSNVFIDRPHSCNRAVKRLSTVCRCGCPPAEW